MQSFCVPTSKGCAIVDLHAYDGFPALATFEVGYINIKHPPMNILGYICQCVKCVCVQFFVRKFIGKYDNYFLGGLSRLAQTSQCWMNLLFQTLLLAAPRRFSRITPWFALPWHWAIRGLTLWHAWAQRSMKLAGEEEWPFLTSQISLPPSMHYVRARGHKTMPLTKCVFSNMTDWRY